MSTSIENQFAFEIDASHWIVLVGTALPGWAWKPAPNPVLIAFALVNA